MLQALHTQVTQANSIVTSTRQQASAIAGQIRGLDYRSGGRVQAAGFGPGGAPQEPAPKPPGTDPELAMFASTGWHLSSPVKAIGAMAPAATVEFDSGEDAETAARLAASSDVAIVFAWQTRTEGEDLRSLSLPGGQDELIRPQVCGKNEKCFEWHRHLPACLKAQIVDVPFHGYDPSIQDLSRTGLLAAKVVYQVDAVVGHEPVGELRDLFHHQHLIRIWLAQNRVQRGYHRHFQTA